MLLYEVVSLQLEAERDILAFKGHCNSLSNMYQKVQLCQKSDGAAMGCQSTTTYSK